MRGGKRLLLPIFIGAAALLLFALPSFFSLGSVSPKLSLHAVATERDLAGGHSRLVVSGAGFDRLTRLILTPDLGDRRALVRSIPTWGRLQSTTVQGDLLYLANNYRGMQVFALSDPARPRQIGSLPLPGQAWNIAVRGEIACVAARGGGLQIVNVDDPENLRLLGAVDLGGAALDVVLAGDRAYVANTLGLQVVDIADPAHPRLLASLKIPGRPHALAVEDGIAYLAAANGGLQIVAVGDPPHLRHLGALETPEPALDIVVRGDAVFLATGASGLIIADVGNPRAPHFLGAVDTPGPAMAIALDEQLAYVADNASGLQVVNIADSGAPRLLGSFQLPGAALSVSLSGKRAFVSAGRNGLHVLDLQIPPSTAYQPIHNGRGSNEGASVGAYTFFAAEDRGVLFLAKQNRQPVATAFTIPTDGQAKEVQVSKNLLFVLNYRGTGDKKGKRSVQIVDVGDPHAPQTLSRIDSDGRIGSFLVSGTDLWTFGEPGLCRYDCIAPQAPRFAGCLPLSGRYGSMAKRGELLVIGLGEGGLHVVDVAEPDAPRWLGTSTLPWHLQSFSAGKKTLISENSVLVADGRNGLLVYSIENPRQPKLIGAAQLPNAGFAFSVGVVGKNIASVADFRHGLHFIDFSDPKKLRIVAKIGNSGILQQVVLVADRIFFATNEGLKSLPKPMDLPDIVVESGSRLTASIPHQPQPGSYSAWAFNDGSHAELPGAVIFPP
ncbi:MAG: hypothetical protein WDA20_00370 [Desulfuromonadales bacterium]